jgi:hypothetical protein
MRLLSRADLLPLSPAEVIGLAECHGLEVEGRTPTEVLDELADFLADFAEAFGEGSD